VSPERDDLAPTEAITPAPPHAHERFLPGAVLGNRYRIVALSGRGGMGEVYRADDLKLGQPVALKFLSTDLERDPDRLQRLLGEVRIARQVSHPNVCRVYDVVEFEGHHFITMEYVDGEDLASLLRRIGRLPQEKALDLARQVSAGLAAAHVQGIVHRDLKPANIMLDGRGRARITDFGLAAATETVRGKEALWGTPAYMAPEQMSGGEITPRTDVYALGLVLFEMFTGRRPLQGSANSDLGSSVEEVPGRLSSFVPGLDPAIDATILKCIEKDPARRPGSAVGLLALLPGGDPLDAALRAGETPSPEMVAAASEEGSLSSAKAWGLFGFALLAAAAAILFGARVTGLDQVPMTRSPDALRERAREIVHLLGDNVPPRSVEWWLDLDDGYAEWSLRQPHAPSLADARPSAFRFNYRQSPEPILPTESSRPARRDPAPSWSGEAYVALDPQGRLLEFSRLDRQLAPPDSVSAVPIDWSPLLALTGADVHGLRSVEPRWTPDVPCDTRAAWVANDGGEPVRLEAAAWAGKPVWLRTVAAWERAERDSPATPRGYTGFAFFVALVLVLFLAFGALARHNLRLGRGDTRGALHVGVAVFLCFGLAISLSFRWAIEPLRVWRWMWRQPYLPALAAWLYYLGVEPFLRRRWPHRLIAWTRLLEGRFADPLVGRELLLGFLAGAGIVLASCIPAAFERSHDVTFLLSTLPLGRGADFWGSIPGALGDALMKGLGGFAVLLLLRVLFRRDVVAWMGLVLVWTLLNLPSWNISVIQWISIVVAAACFVLAVRVGLVAAIVAVVVSNLLAFCAPLTIDFSRWYAWRTGVVAVLLFVIAAWGFRAVMGRRRILSATMFEG
jgi:serine/threonine-protein kinase